MPANKKTTTNKKKTTTNKKKTTTANKKALPQIPQDMGKMKLRRVKSTDAEKQVKANLAQQARQSRATIKKMSKANKK